MPVSAHDVARDLRQRLPSVGVLKLHKLLYYCQGWHLAWTSEPMFRESIEAWANGPVVADLWRDEKRQREGSPSVPLDVSAVATVGYVVSRYGRFTGRQLIVQTHEETPWRTLSMIEDPWAAFNPEITLDMLRDYFAKEDEDEVTLRALGDRALADPAISTALTESLERSTTEPGTPDDLDDIARLVGSHLT